MLYSKMPSKSFSYDQNRLIPTERSRPEINENAGQSTVAQQNTYVPKDIKVLADEISDKLVKILEQHLSEVKR